MTVNQFAMVTGFSRGSILNACRSGRLPCDFYRGRYEISPRYVPVWKAKKKTNSPSHWVGKTYTTV